MTTKVINFGDFEDYLYETLESEDKLVDKEGNRLNVDDIVTTLMEDDKVINTWNKTLTVEDKDLNKALDKLSRAIEVSCKENFDIVINVF